MVLRTTFAVLGVLSQFVLSRGSLPSRATGVLLQVASTPCTPQHCGSTGSLPILQEYREYVVLQREVRPRTSACYYMYVVEATRINAILPDLSRKVRPNYVSAVNLVTVVTYSPGIFQSICVARFAAGLVDPNEAERCSPHQKKTADRQQKIADRQ